MDERDIVIVAVMLPALIIVGGVVVMVAGIRHATQQAAFQHQERLAMIERGLNPMEHERQTVGQRRAYGFKMSLGILLCGLGLGLVMLITFAAGAAGVGFGIGGAVVMVGLAFVASALFTERQPSLEDRMAARRAAAQGARLDPYRPAPPLDPPAPPPAE
jgi:hypothetical protein